jgi:hypothetical protein
VQLHHPLLAHRAVGAAQGEGAGGGQVEQVALVPPELRQRQGLNRKYVTVSTSLLHTVWRRCLSHSRISLKLGGLRTAVTEAWPWTPAHWMLGLATSGCLSCSSMIRSMQATYRGY